MNTPPVYRLHPYQPDPHIIQAAVDIIKAGGLVAFPTETVYGLGADAMNPEAVSRVYEAKGRSYTKPLLMLIAERDWLDRLITESSPGARILMDTFWPGPLTLIFPAAPDLPRVLLGGGNTIGIRFPGPSIAQALVRAVDRPVTAPSANRSGERNPVTASDVIADLDGAVDLILDGGISNDDIPSTVLDMTETPPSLIRPGRISHDDIMKVWRFHVE